MSTDASNPSPTNPSPTNPSPASPNADPVNQDPTSQAPAPRRRRSSVPWRVGALVIVSAGVLLGVLVVTGPLRLYRGVPVAVDFGYAGPIKAGAAVRLSGVVVGSVEKVELLAGADEAAGPDVMVRVHARVEERAMPAVTPEARFFVTTLGVLGEHYLDIVPAAPRTAPLPAGAVVRGSDLARPDLLLPRAAALLEVMSAILDDGREEAVDLMRRTSALIGEIDELLKASEGRPLFEDAKHLLLDARKLMGTLDTLLGDGAELRAALQRADRLGRSLEEANLPRTLGQAESLLSRVEGMPLASPEKQAALLQRLEHSLGALEDVAARADRLLAQIEAGKGGAGRAFHDEQLVEDLKALLHQLRRNPYRLLLPGEREK